MPLLKISTFFILIIFLTLPMIKVRVPQNSIKGQSFLKIVGVKKTYRIAEKMYEILFSNR